MKNRFVSLTDLRLNKDNMLGHVSQNDERLWITRNGRMICAVVSVRQAELIEEFESRSMEEFKRRQMQDLERWKRVKARMGDWEG
ncbi:MAG: hypothetical protein ACRBBV_10050 [Paracoccaceae bacterium]